MEKLQEFYNNALQKVLDIYEVFKDEFGEERVDLQITEGPVEYLSGISYEKFLYKLSGIAVESTIVLDDIPEDMKSSSLKDFFLKHEDKIERYENNLLCLLPSIFNLIVYFPKVTVTNENDKYVEIEDLYARICFYISGTYKDLKLQRTTFPFSHYKARYAHSHLQSITNGSLGTWRNPCLGSGPLVTTVRRLEINYNIHYWGLMAYELSKYVTIESLAGVPYVRLESIGRGETAAGTTILKTASYSSIFTLLDIIDIKDFISYYSKNYNFPIKYTQGQYFLGCSSEEIIISLSNAFIKWYNTSNIPYKIIYEELLFKGILAKYIISEGKIYTMTETNSIEEASRINGRECLKFKGEAIKLNIKIDNVQSQNTSLLLKPAICNYIITALLSVINYKYGKRQQNPNENYYLSNSCEETGIRSSEKPYFI
jgi:hypothetical protein